MSSRIYLFVFPAAAAGRGSFFFIVPPWRGNFSFQTLLLLCAAAGDLLSACHHTVIASRKDATAHNVHFIQIRS